jgi:hypothetical protein
MKPASAHLTYVDCALLLAVAGCMGRVNYDYGNSDSTLSTVLDVPSADACCTQCRLNATCAYWTYQRGQGTCWLKGDQGPGAFTPAAGFVSGASVGSMDAPRIAGKLGATSDHAFGALRCASPTSLLSCQDSVAMLTCHMLPCAHMLPICKRVDNMYIC